MHIVNHSTSVHAFALQASREHLVPWSKGLRLPLVHADVRSKEVLNCVGLKKEEMGVFVRKRSILKSLLPNGLINTTYRIMCVGFFCDKHLDMTELNLRDNHSPVRFHR